MSIFESDYFSQPEYKALELCAVDDGSNIGIGRRDTGNHIKRIQDALQVIMNVDLSSEYGTFRQKTAEAVRAYKESKTPPIRQPWQTGPDDPIVGKRTIKALDLDMLSRERNAPPPPPPKPANPKFNLLLYFSGFVDPGGEDITNETPGDGFWMLAPMRAMTLQPVSRNVFRAWQGSLMVDKGIEAAAAFIQEDVDEDRAAKVIVYGFSAGGSNALDLGRKLEQLNEGRKGSKPLLKIDLLVTVDAAERTDRPRKIDRRVAGSIVKNVNYFQKRGAPSGGARGDLHIPVPSTTSDRTPQVVNIDKSKEVDFFDRHSQHGQIEKVTVPNATADMLAELAE
ncbi:MAG: hypothetical protein M9955_12950 [Rhizobiaceae bacterium]|nr:hypothetical protein [Rhizobiaceae bacterium]